VCVCVAVWHGTDHIGGNELFFIPTLLMCVVMRDHSLGTELTSIDTGRPRTRSRYGGFA